MKSWKKEWKRQLDSIIPALDDVVKREPIPQKEESASTQRTFNYKNIWKPMAVFGAAVAVILVCIFVIPLIGGTLSDDNPPSSSEMIFNLQINPSISVVTDKDGKVLKIVALNDDADVILSQEGYIDANIGLNLEDFLITYIDCASKLGYLNLEGGDAVKLSTPTDGHGESYMESSKQCLQKFFKENGVFAIVLTERQDATEFIELCGVDANDVDSAILALKGAETSFVKRYSSTLSEDQMVALYKEKISADNILNYLKADVLSIIDRIAQEPQDLLAIYELNGRIIASEDNPGWLLKDYWSVKDSVNVSDEFDSLLDEMKNLLDSYKTKYGVQIESQVDLMSAMEKFSSISIAEINQLLDDLDSENFFESAKALIEIASSMGIDVSRYEEALEVPSSIEAYLVKMNASINAQYQNRLNQFSSIYNQKRAQISDEDYDRFIFSLEQEYGSLEEYWNFIKN
ncbi:MAG: hypothetical protein IJ033_02620 [Clostridia bacterium]|nr:hypothetical protein [Clostridia bacterium]